MKIADVKTSRYRVPVEIPLKKDPYYIEVVMVRIETDKGFVGYSISDVFSSVVQEFIDNEIGPFIKGLNPLETEKIWNILYKKFNIRCLTGVWSSAISLIDIALWDIKGKCFGEPVARLLGGASNKAQAYVTFGFSDYNRQELVEVAKSLVKQGHDKLKMVVAIENGTKVREDAERVRVVREAVGDDVDLMIDANYLFNFNQAVELCKLIEPYNIFWFEEPVYGNDYRLLKDLRTHTNIPIAAGQQLGHQWQHRELIVNHAIDISQPNVCFVGGYTEAIKVANLARAFNLPIANGGSWPFHNMHLQAGVSNGTRVEFHLLIWTLCKTIFKDTPEPKEGWIKIPEKPGLGFEPNTDTLNEYRII